MQCKTLGKVIKDDLANEVVKDHGEVIIDDSNNEVVEDGLHRQVALFTVQVHKMRESPAHWGCSSILSISGTALY